MKSFKRVLKYLHRILVAVFILYVIALVVKLISLQSIFTVTASSTVPKQLLYIAIAYLYIWWFIKFENLKVRFWTTERRALQIIFAKFLYFLIFVFEVVISIFVAINFDELLLQAWAFLVGLLLFFVLFKLRKYIESKHELR